MVQFYTMSDNSLHHLFMSLLLPIGLKRVDAYLAPHYFVLEQISDNLQHIKSCKKKKNSINM